MSVYAPVISGETLDLCEDTERLLCEYPGAIELQLLEKADAARRLGASAMFGAEIEFIFVDSPSAENVSETTDDELYAEIVSYMQEGQPISSYKFPKGAVIHPDYHPEPVMVNYTAWGNVTCNDDQIDSGIVEVRAAPAESLEALDRYWKLVEAIGHVAASHGRLAVVLNTHISTAIQDDRYIEYVDFTTEQGALLAALIQQNLERMQSLQVDAGIEPGINVLEAFPRSKDASTAMHRIRLEMRHPLVGIVDPRIDMLSVLDAVTQLYDGTFTKQAIQRIRRCRIVSFDGYIEDDRDEAMFDLLKYCTIYDMNEKRFVLPATLDIHVHSFGAQAALRKVYCAISGEEFVDDPLANNGELIRSFVRDLQLVDGKLQLKSDSPHLSRFDNDYLRSLEISLSDQLFRIVPQVEPESPDMHRRKRRDILRSSTVRRILGDARPYLRRADDAINARQKLIENNMVVVKDTDEIAA